MGVDDLFSAHWAERKKQEPAGPQPRAGFYGYQQQTSVVREDEDEGEELKGIIHITPVLKCRISLKQLSFSNLLKCQLSWALGDRKSKSLPWPLYLLSVEVNVPQITLTVLPIHWGAGLGAEAGYVIPISA